MVTIQGIPFSLDDCSRYNMTPDQPLLQLVDNFDDVHDMFNDEINDIVEKELNYQKDDIGYEVQEFSNELDKIIDKLNDLENDELKGIIKELIQLSTELYDF